MSKRNRKQTNKNNLPQEKEVEALYKQAYNAGMSAVKSADKKIFQSVPKGVQYNWMHNVQSNNVVYPIDKIPDRLLRIIERRNPIVGAIITLRIQQGIEYSHISHDKDIPGWEIVLKDEKATMSKAQEKQKEFLENLLESGHTEDYEPAQGSDQPSSFRERMTQYMRDRLLIDKITWEVERNRKGEAVALWVLDGSTIFPVLPGGFYGSTSQITSGMGFGFNKLSEKIRQARIDAVPPMDEIAYVQELLYGMTGGGITAAFRNSDLLFDISGDLNDVRYYKQGYSLTEKANLAITAFINAITYNSNGLSRGHIPKVAIAMGKESGYTQDALEDLQDEWMANLEGVEGQWNIPLLNGDAKVLNLLATNREMEYQKFTEFTGALICAVMGVDPAEVGLRLSQAQNVLTENTDGKQQFSKNRGLAQLLGDYAYLNNKFLPICKYDFAKDFKFRFNALVTADRGFEADLRKKDVETDTTINELRKAKGLKPDKYGDIIANPQYIQYRLAKEQQEQMSAMQQGGGGGEEQGFGDEDMDMDLGGEDNGEIGDEDINSAVDEAADEFSGQLEKAFRLI